MLCEVGMYSNGFTSFFALFLCERASFQKLTECIQFVRYFAFYKGCAIKSTFPQQSGACHNQIKHCVGRSCVCSFPFSSPTSHRGGLPPKWFLYVAAQALPFGIHNETNETWVSFELRNCHRHSLHGPEQMQHMRIESAARPWADFELPNCHRQSLHHPR